MEELEQLRDENGRVEEEQIQLVEKLDAIGEEIERKEAELRECRVQDEKWQAGIVEASRDVDVLEQARQEHEQKVDRDSEEKAALQAGADQRDRDKV